MWDSLIFFSLFLLYVKNNVNLNVNLNYFVFSLSVTKQKQIIQ